MKENYSNIIKHYESCLAQYGDSHLGVDWPKKEDVETRYKVMLEMIEKSTNEITLLDFGCGAGHLLDYINTKNLYNINYNGLDISEKFVNLCRSKYPEIAFYRKDILIDNDLPNFDYVIMNGVFTEKRDLVYDEMLDYFKNTLKIIFSHVNIGMAFNVMSKQVDWEREDLFHLPLDTLAFFLTKELSRNFIIRNDYGLYEYTVYVYNQKNLWQK